MKLGTKLLVAFLAVGVIPFAVVGIISMIKASDALSTQAYGQLEGVRGIKKAQIENFFAERKGDMGVLVETVGTLRKEAFAKLEAVQMIKKKQIESYFSERLGDVSVLSGNDNIIAGLEAFEQVFESENRKTGGEQWKFLEGMYGDWLKQYKEEYGYYDLFLIAKNGDVLYTVAKESELGENLIKGSLKDSPLGKLFNNAVNGIALQDFEPYAPSNNEPCAFVGAPVKKDGEAIGVVALQLPLDAINNIMQERTGMGKTGEVYLVGNDKLMRSDSFLDPINHSVKASFANPDKGSVDTEASREALAGKDGAKVILDYNDSPVLSAYDPITIHGVKWAIIAEIDVAEAFSPVDKEGNEFYAKYVEMYGYYDLFLLNPDGYAFYTAGKESDYQTNLVDGKYANSGLGKLVRKVLGTKQYGMADFEPYAPSNDEPCAFIAQPVVYDGKVDVVVALQLSLDAINRVMQQRDGMGKTGETYLVGSDKLMRSDSFLDPVNHTVKASFANPQMGSVNTEATLAALAGKTDQKIIIDYNGNPVLSAFTPLKVGDTTWVMIAEIDEAEAFAAVNMLKWLIGVIAVVGIAAIIAVALLITRSITKPVNRIIEGLNEGADQVSSASGQVSSSSQSLAEGASEQAASIEETSSSLEEMSSMTKQNADNARQADTLMKEANQVVGQANDSMTELTGSMEEISKASEETSKIIKTIDEIAFQTNLLALNAAVEAARAGEAGAGFAVVADEVRNLAMRAADAAKNTADLIEGTVKRVKDGSDLVTRTNDAFKQVAESSSKVGELVGEIAAASNEQAQGIDQTNKAVAEMDKVVQQNAANAEESASASEEMNAQAEQMKGMVNELVVLVGGSGIRGGVKEHGVMGESKRVGRKTGVEIHCWEIKNCPTDRRNTCPAYPNDGSKCWMVTGTLCGGIEQGSYHQKMTKCNQCDVYLKVHKSSHPAHTAKPITSREVIPMDNDEFKDF